MMLSKNARALSSISIIKLSLCNIKYYLKTFKSQKLFL